MAGNSNLHMSKSGKTDEFYFSKPNCIAYRIGKDYVTGSPIRQEFLEKAIELIKIFLTTEFEGGRHERRVNKIPC